LNAPADVKEKLAKYSDNPGAIGGIVELVILYGGNDAVIRKEINDIGGTLEELNYGFGIVNIAAANLEKLAAVNGIQYIELPKTMYITSASANTASCILDAQNIYKVDGEGVLIGFIDTGIDYLHPAFIDELGNTRIDFIYDFELGGRAYNKNDINRAIKSDNPQSIVPLGDPVGHGTHVAGVAAAGGKIDRRYYGVAYKSSIAMIKMIGAGKENNTKSTQIMRGVKLLIDKGKELSKPLVINLSFSTNEGAHNGNSLLEQYINTVSNFERVSFIVAAGNEGNAGHHAGGILKGAQIITVNIAPDEDSLVLQMYKNLLDDISIEIKNPSGTSSNVIRVKGGYFQGNLGTDKYIIYYSGPKPFDINGEIIISFVAGGQYLLQGPWSLIITLDKSIGQSYDIWMPISEGLNKDTKFLQPDPFNTVGIPATVLNVISVGSYNHVTNQISSFSGRGNQQGNPIKPDVTAPGENIEAPAVGGGFDTLSGTSISAPEVAGAAALLMQWGIVKGNDTYLYGARLKYYLVKGAKRDRIDISYPDPLWGYGTLCLLGAFELLTGSRANSELFRQNTVTCGDLYVMENYENFIVEYQGDIVGKFEQIQDACAFILDDKYAVVSIERQKVESLLMSVPEIVYVQETVLYTLNQISPLESANIIKFHDNPYLTLRGQGVLVGLIDTGIDYLNTEFMYENDLTRITTLWDQTVKGGELPVLFNFGSEYSAEDINEAIALKKSGGDPYTIVNSRDEIGHGTAMAGIIGGRGRTPELVGAAPDAEFVVVKLKQGRKNILESQGIYDPPVPVYENTDLILAIKYVFEVARTLNKPIVIHIPLGSNSSAHDGTLIVDQFIDDLSKARGVVFVTGTGNQGDGDIHTTGMIEKTGDEKTIELNVDEDQRDIVFSIWGFKPDKLSVGIVSPSGEVIEKIPAKLKGTEEIKFIFEGSNLNVQYFFPQELTGDEQIRIDIRNVRGGIWKFIIFGDLIVNGRYDAWLAQRELLKPNTRFLNPSQFVTLTSPSSGRMIISAGFYNQTNNTIVSASGRGFTRDGRIKPEIAAGGVNVTTTAVGGGVTTITGSSAGSAVTAGAVALLLQWGIVDGNDKTIYSPKVKTYLIRGAKRRPGEIYPNPEWGFGTLDLNSSFENLRSVEFFETEDREIDTKEGLFIRIPEVLKSFLGLI